MNILKKFLTITLLSTMFFACQYQEIAPDQLDNNDLVNSIGFWHNRALDLHSNSANKAGRTMNDYKEIRNELITVLVSDDKSVFNKSEILNMVNKSDKVLKEIGVFDRTTIGKSEQDDHFNNSIKIVNHLESKGEISSDLGARINEVHASIKVLSKQEVLNLVKAIERANWNEKDRLFVKSFTQVFYASSEFWGNNAEINGRLMTQEENLTIIWADAAGALYGMLLGPVMSVIEGALFSSIAAIQ